MFPLTRPILCQHPDPVIFVSKYQNIKIIAPDHTKFPVLRFSLEVCRNCHEGPRRPDNLLFSVSVKDLPHVCVELALLFLHRSFNNNFEDIIKSFLHLFAVQS